MKIPSARPSIEELLDSAVDAMNRQDHKAASSLAGQVLAVDHNNIEAEELLVAPAEGCVVRRMTMLFVDLVDSTGLSTRLEPELYRTVIRRYRDGVHRIVGAYEAHVGSTQGDGLLVTFGHPTPHENDAHRAVSAGLDITNEVAALSEQLERKFGFGVDVRVGIHRGVVTLDQARDEVIGVGANLASRVCDLAEPGTVAVSEPVRRVLRDNFVLESRQPRKVKGFDKPVEYHRVVAERDDAPALRGPLVGRRTELEYLESSWRDALAGKLEVPGVVFTGEGGIGKSRLAEAAIGLAEQSDAVVLAIHGSPFHTDIGLRPIRRMLERASGIVRDSGPSECIRQLRAEITRQGLDADHYVPLLAPVLGIAPDVGEYALPIASAGRLYDQIAAAVQDYLVAAMSTGPGLVVFEDLHWYDEDTLEIVESLLRTAPAQTLVVVTGREVPPLPCSKRFELTPLDAENSEALIAALHPDLESATRRAVVERCDGMPLYIEEIVAKLRAQSVDVAEFAQVPDTLYEALLARLRPDERYQQVIEAAALMGSQVDQKLLTSVLDLESQAVSDILDELTHNRVLQPFGNGGWRFRHELLREVAAELPPPSVRRSLHNRIGAALVTAAADGTPEWPLVARHFELGEDFDSAASGYEKAAADARRRGAINESRTHLTHALDCIAQLPPSSGDRDQREVAVRLERGFLGFAAAGHASVEAAADFERCLHIIDNHPGVEMYATFSALWSFFASRGDLRRAAQLVEALRTQRSGMPGWYHAVNDAVIGSLSTFRGEFDSARPMLEAAASAIERMASPEVEGEWYAPNDPVAGMYSLLALVQFIQGDLNAATASFEQMEKRCETLPFPHGPFTQCYGRIIETVVRTEAGQYQRAADLTDRIAEVAVLNGLDEWVMISGSAAANAGSKALLAAGPPDPAQLEQVTTALIGVVDLWRAIELKAFLCWYDAALVQALIGAGNIDEARTRVDTALAMSAETSWHVFDAELLRLRAKTRGTADERDADLAAAIDLAREQGALTLELRALVDRFRIDGDPYRDELAGTLDRFPAEQDWPELAQARALLL